MFTALNRFFQTLQMGLLFSEAADRFASRPDLLRAFVLSQLGTAPAAQVTPAPAAEELALAA